MLNNSERIRMIGIKDLKKMTSLEITKNLVSLFE